MGHIQIILDLYGTLEVAKEVLEQLESEHHSEGARIAPDHKKAAKLRTALNKANQTIKKALEDINA